MFLRLTLFVCFLCVFISQSEGHNAPDLTKLRLTCHSNGGECINASARCPEELTYKEAIDCTKNQKCCILV